MSDGSAAGWPAADRRERGGISLEAALGGAATNLRNSQACFIGHPVSRSDGHRAKMRRCLDSECFHTSRNLGVLLLVWAVSVFVVDRMSYWLSKLGKVTPTRSSSGPALSATTPSASYCRHTAKTSSAIESSVSVAATYRLRPRGQRKNKSISPTSSYRLEDREHAAVDRRRAQLRVASSLRFD